MKTTASLVTCLVAVVGVGSFPACNSGSGESLETVASRALMHSEELVWTLEGECLKDAERILGRDEAKAIVTANRSPEAADKVERRLREFLRIRRTRAVWKAAERAFVTMTPESRIATNEAAIKAGLRPVDILAEWMTCEGATDVYLMGKVWSDQKALRASAGPVVATFFPEGAAAPSGAAGVKILEQKADRIVVSLFGARVIEETIPGRVQAGKDSVKISWKSNYNYLRDLVRGKKPEDVLEETLVRSDDGYGVEYRDWIGEFLAGADRKPWATLLTTVGTVALGEVLARKEEPDAKKDEPKKDEPRKDEPKHGEPPAHGGH